MPEEKKEYLTKEKFKELTLELEELKTKRRKEIADSLEYAKSLGDLSENAEYQEARELQATVEERIGKLEAILKSAVIVSDRHTDAVGVGSHVTVRKHGVKEPCSYQIVGSEEANTAEGKISNRSPLGTALMGRKKGEKFSFKTPKGTVDYEVVSIQ
jgi:transcription elongation factor GreA